MRRSLQADADADGICDDVDACVENLTPVVHATDKARRRVGVPTSLKGATVTAVLDECGICGGDGILAGDCDCDGNQLDALECGGPCEADADADGICDDVDPCAGELTPVAYATDLARSTSVDVPTSPKEIGCDGNVFDECGICGNNPFRPVTATATETYLTNAASVAATASLLGTATATETSSTNVASVVVTASQMVTATATATSLTPSASVAGLVKPMWTPMASVTTSICVGELDACGVCNGPGAIYERLRRHPW